MNRFLQLVSIIFFILLVVIYFSFSQSNESNLKVMSFNIRYAESPPDTTVTAWNNRKANIKQLLEHYQADIIGMQEVLKVQLDYLAESLPEYKFVGVGREDGKTKGEYSPIFFNSSNLDLIDSGTFWLSESPDSISVGWDAALERICTWAVFFEKLSSEKIYVYNTHFDHVGEKARQESMNLIYSKLKELPTKANIILTGDFNFQSDSKPYKLIDSENSLIIDSKLISMEKHYGDLSTFNGFGTVNKEIEIDFIFCSKNVSVKSHTIIDDKFHGAYPSDHMPVLVELNLN